MATWSRRAASSGRSSATLIALGAGLVGLARGLVIVGQGLVELDGVGGLLQLLLGAIDDPLIRPDRARTWMAAVRA